MEKIKSLLHVHSSKEETTDSTSKHGSTSHQSTGHSSGVGSNSGVAVQSGAGGAATQGSLGSSNHGSHTVGSGVAADNGLHSQSQDTSLHSSTHKPSSTTGVYAGSQGVDHGRTSDTTAISGTGREAVGISSTGASNHGSTSLPYRQAEDATRSDSTTYGHGSAPIVGQHQTYIANLLDPHQKPMSGLPTETESALTHHGSARDPASGGGAEAADGDHPGQVRGTTIDRSAKEVGLGGQHSHATHLGEEGQRSGVGSRQALADRSASYTGDHDVSGHSHAGASAVYGIEQPGQHIHSHGTEQSYSSPATHYSSEQSYSSPATHTTHHSSSTHTSGIDLKTGRGISAVQTEALEHGNTSGIAGPVSTSSSSTTTAGRHHIGGDAPYSHDQHHIDERDALAQSGSHGASHSHSHGHSSSSHEPSSEKKSGGVLGFMKRDKDRKYTREEEDAFDRQERDHYASQQGTTHGVLSSHTPQTHSAQAIGTGGAGKFEGGLGSDYAPPGTTYGDHLHGARNRGLDGGASGDVPLYHNDTSASAGVARIANTQFGSTTGSGHSSGVTGSHVGSGHSSGVTGGNVGSGYSSGVTGGNVGSGYSSGTTGSHIGGGHSSGNTGSHIGGGHSSNSRSGYADQKGAGFSPDAAHSGAAFQDAYEDGTGSSSSGTRVTEGGYPTTGSHGTGASGAAPIYDSFSNQTSPAYGQSTGATHSHASGLTGSEAYSNYDSSVPRSGTTGLAGEGINTTSSGISGTTAGVPGEHTGSHAHGHHSTAGGNY